MMAMLRLFQWFWFVPPTDKANETVLFWVVVALIFYYCQPGKIAASPWVMNSTATAAMSSPMIWVKTRIPVGPIHAPMTSASRNTTQVLTATAPMMAQRAHDGSQRRSYAHRR
jgi:hypothetical protein